MGRAGGLQGGQDHSRADMAELAALTTAQASVNTIGVRDFKRGRYL